MAAPPSGHAGGGDDTRSPRWRIYAAIALVIAGCVAIALASKGESGGSRLPGLSGIKTGTGAETIIRDLTPEQRQKARQILADDPMFQQLSSGKRHSLARLQAWTSVSREELVGALIPIHFKPPIAIPRTTWPVVYPPAADLPNPVEGRAYLVRQGEFTATNVDEVDAWIDLVTNRVVGLVPEGTSQTTWIHVSGGPIPREYQESD